MTTRNRIVLGVGATLIRLYLMVYQSPKYSDFQTKHRKNFTLWLIISQ